MTKRFTAVFLFLCLFVAAVQAFACREALEQDLYEDWIREPLVEKDASLSTGLVTEWSCITFGSHPQTESVPAAFTAVNEYAVQEEDCLADPVLYEKLADTPSTDIWETASGSCRQTDKPVKA